MRHQISFAFTYLTVLYNSCIIGKVDALVGRNVRSVRNGEYPFVVAIIKYYSDGSSAYTCTGSLISRNDVLTSEHCLQSTGVNMLEVIVGSINRQQGTRYLPEWWISFEQWVVYNNHVMEYIVNDIAFLNLLERVPNTIDPALISVIPFHQLCDLQLDIVGWGRSRNNSLPVIVQAGRVRILSPQECEARIEAVAQEYIRVEPMTICTIAEPYVLMRPGDSGGPLVLSDIIIGVNFGTAPQTVENFNPKKVNIHIAVTFYQEFIEDLRDLY